MLAFHGIEYSIFKQIIDLIPRNLFRKSVNTYKTDKYWFFTRLKDNILYEPVSEHDLPEQKDEHILRDEIIHLTDKAAVEQGLGSVELRRTVVFIEDEKTREW